MSVLVGGATRDRVVQQAVGAKGDGSLHTYGWRASTFDFAGTDLPGTRATLEIAVHRDHGTWAYADAGNPPVAPAFSGAAQPTHA